MPQIELEVPTTSISQHLPDSPLFSFQGKPRRALNIAHIGETNVSEQDQAKAVRRHMAFVELSRPSQEVS